MNKDHLMVMSICPEWSRAGRPPGYEQADNWLCVSSSRYDCWQVAQDLIDNNRPGVSVDKDEGFTEKDCWVVSCDFIWPEDGVVRVDHDADDYEYDDIFSRIDALSDMVSQDPVWLGDMSHEDAVRNCSWLVGDLLCLDQCREGVDFWHPSAVPYVEWRAPLYGGRFRNRTAS